MTDTIEGRLRASLAGRYEVSQEIGAGGMATVFLGHDVRHDRDVAIKVLHPDLGAALGGERFLSEIKTTAKLQHPHILPLLDSGDADGLLYYVMPVVTGESLRVRLEREGQLPINESVRIAKEVASALDYAHRQGVIHRDIKPENILLHDGQALVGDFGIALAVSAASGARMTQTGLSLGTPQYMSPEQAMGERTVDARSDIYSLGAVTYEMLTGDPPFTGNSVQAIVSKVMTQRPTPIPTLRETVPQTVEDAVMMALSKLPADRFSTAAEFATALTTATTAFPGSADRPRVGPGRRRIDVIAQRLGIPAIAFALIASGLVLWGWMRPSPSRQVARYAIELDSAEKLSNDVFWTRMALSPDGSRIAYVSGPNDRLFILSRDQLHAVGLPETSEAEAPFFSPDGQKVGYVANGKTLMFVSVSGGSPTTVTDSLIGLAGGAWGPDGTMYVDGSGAKPLVKVRAAAGAVPEWFTQLDSGEADHINPSVLPDGKGVLFTVIFNAIGRVSTGRNYAIAVADIRTGKHRVILDNAWYAMYSPSGHLLYVTVSGTLMAVRFDLSALKVIGDPSPVGEGLRTGSVGAVNLGVSQTGTLAYIARGGGTNHEVVWVSKDGKTQHVDSTWENVFNYPAISPDGNKLAIMVRPTATGNRDIWVKQLDHGPATKLTFEGENAFPTWTPDGKSVTYFSNAGGRYELWTKRADGSAQAFRALRYPRGLIEALWSPDGKWLVVRTFQGDEGNGDILGIRLGVDSAPTSIVATKFMELSPTLSQDGKYLAYSSDESGRQEIYVVPFPNSGSAKWAISAGGGTEPLWAHHHNELYYRDGPGNMVAVTVNTSPTFSVVGSKILFSASQFRTDLHRREYDLAPDDSRFLMIRPLSANAPDKLIVVDNWFEELKNKPNQ